MSKRISNLGGINITPAYDIPGYTYDPVNDWFIDDATGKIFGPKVNPDPRYQSKTVTQNGVVTADEGYDALDSVTVNVPMPTLFCYSGDSLIYTTIRNLVLGVDISNTIVQGNYSGGGEIVHPNDTPYSVVKVRYDEDQGEYVLDPDGDVIAIQDGSGTFYIRDSQGDVTLNS